MTVRPKINSRKELRKINKEKKRCAKLYDDWKDDEFNCGANKFVFGVVSEVSSDYAQNTVASFNTLNDLIIYYNRDTQKYTLDFETCYINIDNRKYLNHLLDEFKLFLFKMFGVSSVIKLLSVTNVCNTITNEEGESYTGISMDTLVDRCCDDYWSSSDVVSLFCKFYIFVKGYNTLHYTLNSYKK